MSQSDIPDAVRRFIAAHVDSVSLLDVLLLLRAAPDKWWTAPETARALVTAEPMADAHLRRLASERLAEAGDEGFRYRPAGAAQTVDLLADHFARRRHTVIALIYRSDARQAATLSDAFKLRRKGS